MTYSQVSGWRSRGERARRRFAALPAVLALGQTGQTRTASVTVRDVTADGGGYTW